MNEAPLCGGADFVCLCAAPNCSPLRSFTPEGDPMMLAAKGGEQLAAEPWTLNPRILLFAWHTVINAEPVTQFCVGASEVFSGWDGLHRVFFVRRAASQVAHTVQYSSMRMDGG
ncbi:unnamed protein product [Pleuronectes platessa]|uniref:Uncharacterized protein n=1 Tax=Pleuronectes platessa TaxID=8262 RepID=A0A9N7Z0N6_PLEPL|nr:unnamed protein product [Pleuronectes platessa]